MNAQFMTAVENLTVDDYEHIDQMCVILKTRKKELRTEKSEILKAEKAAEKAAAKARKYWDKAAEKAEKDAVKAAEKAEKEAHKKAEKDAKALEKLQAAALKHAKREAVGSPKAKNWAFQNFTRWAKGDDGPSEEEISAAGGRRDWLKTEWATLTKEQQQAVDAPWNVNA